jgi:hypothetical protein
MQRYGEAVESRFALQSCIGKGKTMKKVGSVLLLCAATLSLSGCAWRNLGPCYGVGCPTFMMSKSTPPASTAVNSRPAKPEYSDSARASNTKVSPTTTSSGQ